MTSKSNAMKLEFALVAVEANDAFKVNHPHAGNIWAAIRFGGTVNMRKGPTQVDIRGVIRGGLLRLITRAKELNVSLVRFDDPNEISDPLFDTLVNFGSCLQHHKNAISPNGTMEEFVYSTTGNEITTSFVGSSSNHKYYHNSLGWKFIVNEDD